MRSEFCFKTLSVALLCLRREAVDRRVETLCQVLCWKAGLTLEMLQVGKGDRPVDRHMRSRVMCASQIDVGAASQ